MVFVATTPGDACRLQTGDTAAYKAALRWGSVRMHPANALFKAAKAFIPASIYDLICFLPNWGSMRSSRASVKPGRAEQSTQMKKWL